MDQQTYMKLLDRQADKEIEALQTELAEVNKSLHNMTNMVIDPNNENFANYVEDSIQHYKGKEVDLEEAIKVQKGLKQGYQTVITALTKRRSMSRAGTTSKPDIPNMSRSGRINNDTCMETTHGAQRSVLETIMEDSNTTTMPSTSTSTSTTTTSIKPRIIDDATASTTDMNINPDNLIGNVANITTTGVITNVTARSGEMTNDEDITILEHLSTPRTPPFKDSDDQNENKTSAIKGSNASDGGLTNVTSRDNSNAEGNINTYNDDAFDNINNSDDTNTIGSKSDTGKTDSVVDNSAKNQVNIQVTSVTNTSATSAGATPNTIQAPTTHASISKTDTNNPSNVGNNGSSVNTANDVTVRGITNEPVNQRKVVADLAELAENNNTDPIVATTTANIVTT